MCTNYRGNQHLSAATHTRGLLVLHLRFDVVKGWVHPVFGKRLGVTRVSSVSNHIALQQIMLDL